MPSNAVVELERSFLDALEADPTPAEIPMAEPSKMGRPRIIQDPRPAKTEVEEEFLETFDETAGERGLSRREAMREAMRDWVAKHRAA